MTRKDLQRESSAKRIETVAEPGMVNDPFLTPSSGSTETPIDVLRHRQLYPLLVHSITLIEA